MHLNQLEKEQPQQKENKPKVSRRKEIIKIPAEINEKEMETEAKINKNKSWFFEKLSKISKPLSHSTG